MEKFVHDHPWMTLILGLAALNTIGYVVRGPLVASSPVAGPKTLTQGIMSHKAMGWTQPITHFIRRAS